MTTTIHARSNDPRKVRYGAPNVKELLRENRMDKQKLLVISAALYSACLIVSNIIAGQTFEIGSTSLPCSVVIFPVVYIINDMLTEVYGFKTSRMVILAG